MPAPRTSAHRVYFSDLAGVAPGATLQIQGDEANHAARAKRLRPGETVTLIDARGTVADARVLRAETGKRAVLEVAVGAPRRVAPVCPRVQVWCPPPKGDRLETMIDQLSQTGVAAWRPLRTARAERDAYRPEKLDRVTIESAKQCARAWRLEIGDWIDFAQAIGHPGVMLADASGTPPTQPAPSPSDTTLLVGPEGGWSPDELEQARAAGCSVIRFGPHAMRIETAAVAAAACLLAHADPATAPDLHGDAP